MTKNCIEGWPKQQAILRACQILDFDLGLEQVATFLYFILDLLFSYYLKVNEFIGVKEVVWYFG